MTSTFPPLKAVMIAHDAAGVPPALTSCLSSAGYEIIATASEDSDVLRMIQSLNPQLVLIIPGRSYPELRILVRQIASLRSTAIVVLAHEWDTLLAGALMEEGVSGYIIAPFEVFQVRAVLESSWHYFQTLQALQENLELRKLLEKAKGLLMQEREISEEQAHQTILRMSQDQGISLKELCHSIVQVKTILAAEKLKKN